MRSQTGFVGRPSSLLFRMPGKFCSFWKFLLLLGSGFWNWAIFSFIFLPPSPPWRPFWGLKRLVTWHVLSRRGLVWWIATLKGWEVDGDTRGTAGQKASAILARSGLSGYGCHACCSAWLSFLPLTPNSPMCTPLALNTQKQKQLTPPLNMFVGWARRKQEKIQRTGSS